MLLPYSISRRSSGDLLIACLQVALNHHPQDVGRALLHLLSHIIQNIHLAVVVLIGVGVAAVHHHAGVEFEAGHFLSRPGYMVSREVWPPFAAPQYQVAVGVAGGGHNAGQTGMVNAQEVVGLTGGQHRVHRRLQAARRCCS